MHDSFTLSDFLRRSGEVLRALEQGDVVLRRRDEDDLVLTTVDRSEALRDATRLLARVLRTAFADDDGRRVVLRALSPAAPWTAHLSTSERELLVRELALAAETAADLGVTQSIRALLEDLAGRARVSAARVPHTHETRPFSIPDDVDSPGIEKARGVVELPARVRWSGPRRAYNLDDPADRRSAYEQVLREGTDEDVRRFIDVDTLIEIWDELFLPPRIRRAWADFLRRRRGAGLQC